MGYYTSYDLEIVEGEEELIELLREECDEAGYAICSSGDTKDDCSWYEHDQDLKAFSLKHPEALFKLSGEGEEAGDLWLKYFRNGKVQVCNAKIAYDDFNEDLLV
jgi:hypothetical protein